MRSSDKTRAGVAILLLTSALTSRADAQSDAGVRYESAREQEQRVSGSAGATVDDFRFVINRYWSLVRRYPSSGYADNAVWQAGNLAIETFRRFGEDRDKRKAAQLLQWLTDQYPHSPLIAQASTQLEELAAPLLAAETIIRAVHREVLPEVVRVTVELDREVPFYQELLADPSRVFFDLKGTKTVPALADATLRYDADVVREIRFGRHPNTTTRIVLDLENVRRYSVFTLYEPYRIVIDCEPAYATALGGRFGEASSVATSSGDRFGAASPATASGRFGEAGSAVATGRVGDARPQAAAARLTTDKTAIPVARPTPIAPTVTPPTATLDRPIADDTPDPPVTTSVPATPAANSRGTFSVARQLGLGISRVVIDAGHGGHDPGASAFGITEAELVLDVSLRLEKLLQQQPGIDVILTRRTNDYLPLEERTEIANRESADLFLSIHANASANASARGVETYFLNFALNRQAETIAARENAASERTMNSLTGIIKAITLNSKLDESRDFAGLLQRAQIRTLRPSNPSLKDLGVKQAPFMVLIGASMPSALAEISFVTNRQEARLLKTSAYRQKIAEALLAGIVKYQQTLKKVQRTALK